MFCRNSYARASALQAAADRESLRGITSKAPRTAPLHQSAKARARNLLHHTVPEVSREHARSMRDRASLHTQATSTRACKMPARVKLSPSSRKATPSPLLADILANIALGLDVQARAAARQCRPLRGCAKILLRSFSAANGASQKERLRTVMEGPGRRRATGEHHDMTEAHNAHTGHLCTSALRR